MKGAIQWYVRAGGENVRRVVLACVAAGLHFANPANGRINYVSDEEGREGEQIEVTEEQLLTLAGQRARFCFQLWSEPNSDVFCTVEAVPAWDATCIDFDLDGWTAAEARELSSMLFRVKLELEDVTLLWLHDRVGVTLEYGDAHEWDGRQAPAWSPPPL